MAANELSQSLCNGWSALSPIITTTITTLISSLAGAFAGAAGAQRIAERSKNREELLLEIRNTNAAISVSYGICNSFLCLKKQHVKGMKEFYDVQKAELLEFNRKRETGEISLKLGFDYKADFKTIQLPSLPIDTLRTLVFERLSIVGRPLNLTMILIQTSQSLKESLEKRNNLIEKYKTEFGENSSQMHPFYFGMPYGDGHVNTEYPDTINAIYSLTDDSIFFSNLLRKDLYLHGKCLSDNFKKKFKKESPQISETDFAKAEISGLMPDEKDYSDWINSFIKKA